MKKASALTAALSGAQPAAPPPSHPAKSGGLLKGDNGAFPCLAYARDGGDSGGDGGALADVFGGLDLSAIAIVGSAPTHISANGVSLARAPNCAAAPPPRARGGGRAGRGSRGALEQGA